MHSRKLEFSLSAFHCTKNTGLNFWKFPVPNETAFRGSLFLQEFCGQMESAAYFKLCKVSVNMTDCQQIKMVSLHIGQEPSPHYSLLSDLAYRTDSTCLCAHLKNVKKKKNACPVC